MIATPQLPRLRPRKLSGRATRLHASKHIQGNQEEIPASVQHPNCVGKSIDTIFSTDITMRIGARIAHEWNLKKIIVLERRY
jgi:hypothetical protein